MCVYVLAHVIRKVMPGGRMINIHIYSQQDRWMMMPCLLLLYSRACSRTRTWCLHQVAAQHCYCCARLKISYIYHQTRVYIAGAFALARATIGNVGQTISWAQKCGVYSSRERGWNPEQARKSGVACSPYVCAQGHCCCCSLLLLLAETSNDDDDDDAPHGVWSWQPPVWKSQPASHHHHHHTLRETLPPARRTVWKHNSPEGCGVCQAYWLSGERQLLGVVWKTRLDNALFSSVIFFFLIFRVVVGGGKWHESFKNIIRVYNNSSVFECVYIWESWKLVRIDVRQRQSTDRQLYHWRGAFESRDTAHIRI